MRTRKENDDKVIKELNFENIFKWMMREQLQCFFFCGCLLIVSFWKCIDGITVKDEAQWSAKITNNFFF